MSRCHTNLSQFPVRLRDTRNCLILQAASDPGPGTDVWLKCLPRLLRLGLSGASWKSQAETRVTQSLWPGLVIAGIMTLLRLPGYPWQWQHSRDCHLRGARVWGKFSYSRWWTKRGYYWEWDWADLAEMGHQYFFVYREYAAVIN